MGLLCAANISTMRFLLYGLLITLLMSQQAASETTLHAEIEKQIVETEKLIASARDNNGLWRDTEKMLITAKEFFQKKDMIQASKLIEEAHSQASLANRQFSDQRDADLLPYYLKP